MVLFPKSYILLKIANLIMKHLNFNHHVSYAHRRHKIDPPPQIIFLTNHKVNPWTPNSSVYYRYQFSIIP